MTIDNKIAKLRKLTSKFLFIEHYAHEQTYCYKIDNDYTKCARHKVVLCNVDEGIEYALDRAIEFFEKEIKHFYNGTN